MAALSSRLWRRRSAGAIPAADAPRLAGVARRTAIVRAVLACALVAALAAAVAAAGRLEVRQGGFLPSGTSGIVVLDLSTSVEPRAYRRLVTVLEELVESDEPVGLVVFSDTAYEVIPPGTRGLELRPLIRYFKPIRPARLSSGERAVPSFYPRNPWMAGFRGGTRISTGLRLARQILIRDRIGSGSVLLVSDLDDSSFDVSRLTETLVQYRHDSIPLRVVPLFADAVDRRYFWRLLGARAFVEWDEMETRVGANGEASPIGETPRTLLIVAGVLVLLLAANEFWCGRLQVVRSRRAREVAA